MYGSTLSVLNAKVDPAERRHGQRVGSLSHATARRLRSLCVPYGLTARTASKLTADEPTVLPSGHVASLRYSPVCSPTARARADGGCCVPVLCRPKTTAGSSCYARPAPARAFCHGWAYSDCLHTATLHDTRLPYTVAARHTCQSPPPLTYRYNYRYKYRYTYLSKSAALNLPL